MGPESIGRTSHWIQKLAPSYSAWTVPPTADRITRRAKKEATTANLTGGAIPITRPAMADAVGRRMDTRDPARWQAVLFGMVCYLTVSRGAEVFSLTKERCKITSEGVVLHLPRTKTDTVGVKKLVPFSKAGGTNVGNDLKYLASLPIPAGQRIWREVRHGKLAFKREISQSQLRRHLQDAFGEDTTWHSFRKGATSALVLDGVPAEAIVPLGTWANPNSLRPYIANAVRTDARFASQRAERMLRGEATTQEKML